MTKEKEFSKTFEEWYEDWFKKPFPTDKEEAEELKADCDLQSVYEYCCKRQISVEKQIENAIKVLMDNGNLFFREKCRIDSEYEKYVTEKVFNLKLGRKIKI